MALDPVAEVEAVLAVGARAGLEKWGEAVQGAAQQQAPKAEGTLRASADHQVVETPFGPEVVIFFPLVYAAAQHEHVEYHHDVGKAKYLEDPFKAYLPRLPAAVAAGQRLALKAAGII